MEFQPLKQSELGWLRRLEAIHLKPDNGEIYYNLGSALRDNGNAVEAIKYYEKALSLQRYAPAYNNMGLLLKSGAGTGY